MLPLTTLQTLVPSSDIMINIRHQEAGRGHVDCYPQFLITRVEVHRAE